MQLSIHKSITASCSILRTIFPYRKHFLHYYLILFAFMTVFTKKINPFFLGIYGKLDVLYAGIVAENACAENKNRSVTYAFFEK